MFPLDTIAFENRTGARLLFAKNSQQQVTGRHEVVFQRVPFVCGMLENTACRFCERYIYCASLTSRKPTWLLPVLTSPLPRVPTMYRVQY